MNELLPLSQIFSNRLFRIPDYQRGYAWQDSQLRDFWEDLINLQTNRYHYTGLISMKLLSNKEAIGQDESDAWLLNSGYKAYHIVDGQQRLTTAIILLNELLCYVRSLPENKGMQDIDIYLGDDSIRDITRQYICRQKNIITTYLFGYEKDNPSSEYLRHEIFGQKHGGTLTKTYYTRNLKYAKEFFKKEIHELYQNKGFDELCNIYRKLTLNLMFNIHEIKDDYDVFVAFETMNNRGKRLTNLELLKNRLIYLTTLYSENILPSDEAKVLRNEINDAWKEIYHQLGRNEEVPLLDDELLRAHWIMYFSYSRRKGDDYIKFLLNKFSHKAIYGTLIANVDETMVDDDPEDIEEEEVKEDNDYLSPREIEEYVLSLKEAAKYWYYTFYPDSCDEISDEEKLWLGRLNRIGIAYFRPMVATALIPSVEVCQEDRVALYEAIENFIFVNFRMAMYQSSYKSSDYYRKTKKLYMHELSAKDLAEDIETTTNNNENSAIEEFITKTTVRFNSGWGFYGWKDLKYFLFEYEYSLACKHKKNKLEWSNLSNVVKDKISIEHIFPQTPTKPYWKNLYRQFNDQEKKILSGSLGNMLPLAQSINSSLQNDSFEDKKQRGYINGCHSEVEVAQNTDWDAKNIYDRGMKLLAFMEDRWNFEFTDEQKNELLHLEFVNDGREIPEELHEDITEETLSQDVLDKVRKASVGEIRKAYWTQALPVIVKTLDGPYSNVQPSESSYLDGFFGINALNLTCSVNISPVKAVAGLWIDTWEKETSKAVYDVIFAHKDEIEANITMPIEWKRKDNNRSCSINIVLDGVDFRDPAQWDKITEFHAQNLKALADHIVYKYEDEIRKAEK